MAALVRRDQWHERVVPLWREEISRCLTTEPVLVEATHIVHGYGFNPARALEFVIADATLVALADRLRLTRVFTVDRKGFRAYRGARGVALEVIA